MASQQVAVGDVQAMEATVGLQHAGAFTQECLASAAALKRQRIADHGEYVIRQGSMLNTPSGTVAYVVIGLYRNIEKANDTANAWAHSIGVDPEAIAIFASVDAKDSGDPGYLGLYNGLCQQVLPAAQHFFGKADLVVFAEANMRLAGHRGECDWTRLPWQGRGSLWHYVLDMAVKAERPFVLLGFDRTERTKRFLHRKPDFGAHLWAIPGGFIGTFAGLLRTMPPQRFDKALLLHWSGLVCYTVYSIAGYHAHVSECSDPPDAFVDDGMIRPALMVELTRDDAKELTIANYIP